MTKNFRMMSEMVLYKLEQELGSYVIRKSPEINIHINDLSIDIENREKEKNQALNLPIP